MVFSYLKTMQSVMKTVQLNELKAKLIEAQEKVDSIQISIQLLLTEKEIPLSIRWDAFMQMSGDQYRETYIQHFDTLKAYVDEDKSVYRNSFEDYYLTGDRYSRHETIYIESLIEGIENNMEYFKEDPENKYTRPFGRFKNEAGEIVNEATIEALKEECLERKIQSFDFDW